MRKLLLLLIFPIFILGCNGKGESNFTQFVDPYIGSGDHGHVFVGANLPFGFVQLGPNQLTQGWDWCSGYNWVDSTIVGFGHLHLSGTGIGDLGDVVLMPAVGEVKMVRGVVEDPVSGIYSHFSHEKESVRPGFYSVYLDRYDISVELTATKRVGFHKYKFPKSEDAKVIFDLQSGIGWDTPVDCYIKQESETLFSGYRKSKGWAESQEVFFVAEFSKPVKSFAVYQSGELLEQFSETPTGKIFAAASFGTEEGEEVMVKVALSPVSIENAKLNMKEELSGWDFAKTVKEADSAWNEELSKIKIETSNLSDKKIFYTALYHTMTAPSHFQDLNGDYRGADLKVYNDTSFLNYTTFSLWDTYRAAHPLMTIIHPEKVKDMGNTMIDIFKKQGKLPVWHLMGNETNCMVGNPGIPVLADMVLKGYDIDAEAAFEAMKSSAMLDERGLKWMKKYGYLPYDLEDANESVAKTLEYALADWCVAQVALKLGKIEDYNYFTKRSKAYKFFFDSEKRFMRALSSKGKFREPFDPFRSSHRVDDYTEGNAWQYTWLVPHDVEGLVELFGGKVPFIEKLDSLFTVKGDMGDEASPDISGLIGQYAHGNEPSHHIIYLYTMLGQQWKTADRVREVLTTLYHDAPAGLCGNEDVGQMSAWYIMSAMGFYQVAPAGGVYYFGSPLMDKVTINVGGDKNFTIIAHNNSRENKYVKSIKLNGKTHSENYIKHSDIMEGGLLEFEMTSTPPPAPYGALPTSQQIEWQKMEHYMFAHFGPNTFTDVEWGDGKEDPKVFLPTDLDCRQWAKIAKESGLQGIIVTAKHHDGFCLWPTNYSTHTVRESLWKEGKGDVIKELSEACKEYGIKMGVYLSPWDQNHPTYGTADYNKVFAATLDEILSSYGDIFEQWFDGACGVDMKFQYDWKLFRETVYKNQPNAIIFSDTGPGCRWIGNERGFAGATNWSTINLAGYLPGRESPSLDTLNSGNCNGSHWSAGEVDVSIRPGWFYSPSTDNQVKSVSKLMQIYYESVGRNATLLLNVPPDRRGKIHPNDSLRLMEFKRERDAAFKNRILPKSVLSDNIRGGEGSSYSPSNIIDNDYDTYWATDDAVTLASVTLNLKNNSKVNMILLQEFIPLGQRIKEFNVESLNDKGEWVKIASGTTIGYKRIIRFNEVQTSGIRVNITKSLAPPTLNNIELYHNKQEWKEVWREDFNGNAVDTLIWSRVPRDYPDWKNKMADDDSLVWVKDGNLILRGVVNGTKPEDTSAFLTGGIWGKYKKSFWAGRVDIKAKIDCGTGFWPALWLLPDHQKWPHGGEIDIMEHLNRDSIVYQTAHSPYTQLLGIKEDPQHSALIKYNPGEFNIYSVEIHTDSLVFFVNGKRNFTYPRIETPHKGQFPFADNPFYLILSAQLGGSWVGEVNPADLPLAMSVDWIKFSELRSK